MTRPEKKPCTKKRAREIQRELKEHREERIKKFWRWCIERDKG